MHSPGNQKIVNKSNLIISTMKTVQSVTMVAFVLATLFTAWTEPGLLPATLFQKYTIQATTKNIKKDQSIATATARSRPLVGIVAGHSGHDSGAVCLDGLTEVSINQQIASLVQNILIANNIDVEILQEFDSRLIDFQAAALISIHADSCDYINNEATGFKVAAALSNPRPDRSARLTTCLRKRYSQITGLPLHNSITLDMTNYHAFDEINNETTAAIIEVGFMNLDRQLLTQNPNLVAQGISAGVLCFLNNEDTSN